MEVGAKFTEPRPHTYLPEEKGAQPAAQAKTWGRGCASFVGFHGAMTNRRAMGDQRRAPRAPNTGDERTRTESPPCGRRTMRELQGRLRAGARAPKTLDNATSHPLSKYLDIYQTERQMDILHNLRMNHTLLQDHRLYHHNELYHFRISRFSFFRYPV